MEIKIGEKSFRTRKPSNLDAVLIANTGCSAAEAVGHLNGWPSSGRIASALRPFLPDDAPSVPELAQSIASADNGPEVLIAVKKLYAGTEPVEPATPPSDPAAT